ncbi:MULTISPECIES: GyrI-like domain-containing protein [Stenotrophomonas]|uniref:AraC family transcriptional regulator n=1 Tax=Stenotrophomonas TaxID=40323 RepID=UPI00077061E9|nr:MULTISPECIES: GyrI-like domain-containing protein [Stenotrophomonas]AMJ56024.1 AraC family transcriptional regulator [Stenotrophomonas sp. KCTC 12332]
MKANVAQLPRLDRVISCLQQSIDAGGPLPDLDALAAIAHYSPFHFHRVYRALTGETIGRTVQRLRVVKALQRLAHSNASVTEIALLAGYDTPQALARVLRDTVDASASQLRMDPQRMANSIEQLSRPLPLAEETAPLSVEVITLEPFEVVALRAQGAFDDLDAVFGELFGWAAEQGLVEQLQQLIGMPLGDHRELPADELLFDCALVFDAELPAVPAPLQRLVLGGGRMVRLRHVGSYGLLEEATDQLLRDWLPGSGHALRDAPLHYHFLDDPEDVPEAILRADIYVPLAAG